MLFVNADDWGWLQEITDRILACYLKGSINSVSAMTFMKDSERAAELALENGMEVGLHLNLIQELTGKNIYTTLQSHHNSLITFLRARKINQVLYNPFLRKAFEYVFQTQWEEFHRLYGDKPTRLDGHHHMHLCMNVLASRQIPKGLKVRRNFTFRPGEKGLVNRLYRRIVDSWLTSRFVCTDYFFALAQIDKTRLQQLALLSKTTDVEIMVHPGVEKEYQYLLSGEWLNLMSRVER